MNRRRASVGGLLLAELLCVGCGATTVRQTPAPAPVRVLFVGNSLTYTNDLPATLAALAASADEAIRVSSSTGPDLGIGDHLEGRSNALAQLRSRRWDFVILQQGPTTAGMCRDSLVSWTKQFAPLIRAAGATPAVLMTWPGAAYPELWDEVRVSFQAAAAAVGGTFLPAGEAWRVASTSDTTLRLYGRDGFHPSPAGTFAAALEIYERVTGRDARTLPPTAFAGGKQLALDTSRVRLLQRAAHEVNERFHERSIPTDAELAAPSRYRAAAGRC